METQIFAAAQKIYFIIKCIKLRVTHWFWRNYYYFKFYQSIQCFKVFVLGILFWFTLYI